MPRRPLPTWPTESPLYIYKCVCAFFFFVCVCVLSSQKYLYNFLFFFFVVVCVCVCVWCFCVCVFDRDSLDLPFLFLSKVSGSLRLFRFRFRQLTPVFFVAACFSCCSTHPSHTSANMSPHQVKRLARPTGRQLSLKAGLSVLILIKNQAQSRQTQKKKKRRTRKIVPRVVYTNKHKYITKSHNWQRNYGCSATPMRMVVVRPPIIQKPCFAFPAFVFGARRGGGGRWKRQDACSSFVAMPSRCFL